MVNPAIIVGIGLAGVAVLGSGVLDSLTGTISRAKESLGSGGSATVTTPTSQTGNQLGSEIPQGSKVAVGKIESSFIDPLSVAAKSEIALQRFRGKDISVPSSIEFFRKQQDFFLSNISTKQRITLSDLEIQAELARPFSARDLSDVTALNLRRGSGRQQSGADIVITKRLEALKSRKILGESNFQFSGGVRTRSGFLIDTKGGLFGKSNFALGGKTQAQFIEQQRVKALQIAKRNVSQIRGATNQAIGAIIQESSGTTTESQRAFLLAQGINLQGSALNAKALGRLQEQGLIIL